MQVTVKGKQLDVGDALREHVTSELGHIVEKYFAKAQEATVTFSQEAHLYRCDVSVHVGRGILLQASGENTDIYPTFDTSLAKIEKRLRRHKRRLREHHHRPENELPAEIEIPANAFVLSHGPEDEHDHDDDTAPASDPMVVAEMTTSIPLLTVAEAVMRMDLADLPAMMFRNKSHNGMNMIYRRPDGNIGWVDPSDPKG